MNSHIDPESAHRVQVVLPVLGAAEVHVSLWFAQLGDRIREGDRLIELIVGGATFDVPAPVTGRLVQQFVYPRDAVKPGQCLGVIAAEPE